MIRICGPKDKAPSGAKVINVTSGSSDWGRDLSPFLLGPCRLYETGNEWPDDVYTATNVENAWQFSKVYAEHVTPYEKPSIEYWKWAEAGWRNPRAQRYPMGKGRKPEFSWWAGEKLTYLQARRRIYIPVYAAAVRKSDAWLVLNAEAAKPGDLWLWDFDGYDHVKHGVSLADVPDRDDRKMGHAFVLAVMLEGVV